MGSSHPLDYAQRGLKWNSLIFNFFKNHLGGLTYDTHTRAFHAPPPASEQKENALGAEQTGTEQGTYHEHMEHNENIGILCCRGG